MRRTWRMGALALGTTASLLLGSGLISRLSDSVTSSGNRIESGERGGVEQQQHDVRAALLDSQDPGGCPTDAAAYQSDGLAAGTFGTGGGADAFAVAGQLDNYCIRNFGSTTGQLLVSLANVLDSETGCSDTEAAVDSTCGSGTGELSGILDAYYVGYDSAGSCKAESPPLGTSSVADAQTTPTALVQLDPGATCELYLYFAPRQDTPGSALDAAQTDAMDFDVVFTLADPSAPSTTPQT